MVSWVLYRLFNNLSWLNRINRKISWCRDYGKVRYRTQEEVLDVVKNYDRGIQLPTIAIDYFHTSGEYSLIAY